MTVPLKRPELLTEAKIQAIMFKDLVDKGYTHIAPNCCALPYEADLLAITTSDFLYEFEIKISRDDFKNESRASTKKNKHHMYQNGESYAGDTAGRRIPSCFYYVMPEGLITVEEVPKHAGLIIVNPNWTHIEKKAPRLHKQVVDPYVKEKITTSLMWKVFKKKEIPAMECESYPRRSL